MFKFSVDNLVDNLREWWKRGGETEDGVGEKNGGFVEKRICRKVWWKSPRFYTNIEASY